MNIKLKYQYLINKYKQSKIILIAISLLAAMILIAASIFALYFNNVFKNFFIDNVNSSQNSAAEKILDLETQLKNISAQILNNYNVVSLLYSEQTNDLENIDKAIRYISSMKIVTNIKSIRIIKPTEGLIWTDTNMNPQTLDEYYLQNPMDEQILSNYEQSKQSFFSDPQENMITYIFNDNSGRLVLFNLSNEIFSEIMTNLSRYSNSWIYYNNTLLYENEGNFFDVLTNEKIKKNINEEKNHFLSDHALYVHNQFNNLSFVTKINYNNIIIDGLKTTSFIWIITLSFILILILLFMMTSKYFKNIISKYISQLASIEYRANNDKLEETIFKVFNAAPLNTKEKNMLNTTMKATEKKFCAGIIKIDKYKKIISEYSPNDIVLLKYAIRNITEELFATEGTCKTIDLMEDSIALLTQLNNDAHLEQITLEINKNCNKHLGISLSFAFTRTLSTVEQLIQHASVTNELINYTYSAPENALILEKDILARQEENHSEYPLQLQEEIIHTLNTNTGQSIQLENLLNQFMQKTRFLNRQIAENWLLTLVMNTVNNAKNLKNKYIDHQYFLEIINSDTLEESINCFKSILFPPANDKKEDLADTAFANMVEKLTEENYADQSFDLTYLADKLYLNKVYAGRKFRLIFHQTFSQYLTEYRIQKACELLTTTNRRVGDIATLCGFNSSAYFVTIFKKYKNMTPQTYREKETGNK
ncbi:helix-turn-helix domain-containing protein [Ructibacterium gallinarum]|uniref:Helix-turn-helix transcriptional regulator n=1 Tax=Ructibacterium gallinarum TaxID=2779355 RepID=A0A9D5M3R7_9FIRM|nr:helix-turn-helix transcriptional regulator [Ructibacterium gallinarum]MBE5040988.1 helix-turn-helix transcriptional regulator [Ructibacterium gallinarum]